MAGEDMSSGKNAAKYTVDVTQEVEVEIDESKFTPEFMADFREHFYGFQTVKQHVEHLAQLFARGLAADDRFIEGYGPAKDFGIKFVHVDQWQETVMSAK